MRCLANKSSNRKKNKRGKKGSTKRRDNFGMTMTEENKVTYNLKQEFLSDPHIVRLGNLNYF